MDLFDGNTDAHLCSHLEELLRDMEKVDDFKDEARFEEMQDQIQELIDSYCEGLPKVIFVGAPGGARKRARIGL